jgi:hypothetical protein
MPLPIRPILALLALGLLAACGAERDLDDPVEPIGAFRLGHNIVVADNVQKVQPSRDVSPDEWEAAIAAAVDRRFSRYTGDQLYHIAVGVQGYSVAVTGIPVVLAPKSVLVVSANVWDDSLGRKLNAEPEQFTIIEEYSPENALIGSGATQSKEEQVASLSAQVARQIEGWMRRNPEWFAPKAAAAGPSTPTAPALAPGAAAPLQ